MTGPNDVRAACGFPPKPDAYRVRCPICQAAVNESCIEQATGKRMDPHPSRVDLAAESAVVLAFRRPDPPPTPGPP